MLHGVWPSPALHNGIYTLYIHFWGLLSRNGILPGAKFTLHPSLAFSYIASITAWHSSSGHQPNVAAWYKEWNYGTLAEGASGATYTLQGGHHVGLGPHSRLVCCASCMSTNCLWSPYVIGRPYIFSCCGLSFLLFFPRLISAAADWMSAILPHMVWP